MSSEATTYPPHPKSIEEAHSDGRNPTRQPRYDHGADLRGTARARFDEWAVTFRVDVDPELVDREQLLTWLDIGGRRIGVGNWRPEKSGRFGRFKLENIQNVS